MWTKKQLPNSSQSSIKVPFGGGLYQQRSVPRKSLCKYGIHGNLIKLYRNRMVFPYLIILYNAVASVPVPVPIILILPLPVLEAKFRRYRGLVKSFFYLLVSMLFWSISECTNLITRLHPLLHPCFMFLLRGFVFLLWPIPNISSCMTLCSFLHVCVRMCM